MKTLKIYWDHYQREMNNLKSMDDYWKNIGDTDIDSDIKIYIDSEKHNGESIFLVEPFSIFPELYNYVLLNREKFKHIISYDSSFFGDLDNFTKVPPPFRTWIEEKDQSLWIKSKNISFIASNKTMCKEHIYRQDMVFKYQYDCDVYGRGRTKRLENKIDGMRDYRFSFCMENYVTDMYYTEKVLDSFVTGTIPIYFGSRSICNIFDKEGIVWLEDINDGKVLIESLNEDFYNSKIDSVKKNYHIAKLMNNSIAHSIDCFMKNI